MYRCLFLGYVCSAVYVSGRVCTAVCVLGHVRDAGDDDTAVNPNFRSAKMCLTCFLTWASVPEDGLFESHGAAFGQQMLSFGDGVYINESPAYLPKWKTDFWGTTGHYARLLQTKRRWDPENLFTCQYCVGSDGDVGINPTGPPPRDHGLSPEVVPPTHGAERYTDFHVPIIVG
jgi:hypothetical protein